MRLSITDSSPKKNFLPYQIPSFYLSRERGSLEKFSSVIKNPNDVLVSDRSPFRTHDECLLVNRRNLIIVLRILKLHSVSAIQEQKISFQIEKKTKTVIFEATTAGQQLEKKVQQRPGHSHIQDDTREPGDP